MPVAVSLAAEARATLRLGLPLIAGQIAQMAGGVVETMLAGHLSADVLGAVAVGNSIWTLAVFALIGLMLAVSPSVAQLDGAGRRDETAPVFVQAAWIAVVAGVLLAVLMATAGPAFADLVGVDPALRAPVRAFLVAAAAGAPGLGLYLACRGLTDGIGRTRVSMGFAVLGLAVLAPLGWGLMYGRFGTPPLGALGAGIAVASMCWTQSLAFLAWLLASGRFAGLGWPAVRLMPDWVAIAALVRLGLPMTVSILLEGGLFSATALLIARFGPAAVAGHQIALNVAGLCFMVPLGVGMAMTVRVGNAVGRGDAPGVRRAAAAGLALVVATQTVSCGTLLALPVPIARLYTADPAVVSAAAGLLLLAGVFQFSDGLQVAAAGALRGLKDTRVPMLITAFSYWCAGMPVGVIAAFGLGLAARGLWIGLIAGLTSAAALLLWRLNRHTAASKSSAAGVRSP